MQASRLSVLDGWRALSIMLVLCAHLLPLGPKAWRLNETFAPMGMALFFTLSGFLITRLLLTSNVRSFLIRRFFRIIPLAWLTILIVLPFNHADAGTFAAHLLFYANVPPGWLGNMTEHLWSLCVEVQFYVGIAALVALLGRRGLYLIVPLSLAVTAGRIATGNTISIVTLFRVDEILAGCIVALAYTDHFGPRPAAAAKRLNVYWMMPIVILCCHPASGPLQYLRPYVTAAMVGISLVNAPKLVRTISAHRITVWIAEISYALYVVHGVLTGTWLGQGDKLVKYLKRPLLFGLTFLLAHLSTYYYERRWINFARQLTAGRGPKPALPPSVAEGI
jgi:peptidoglycan/LPS O-acetylase OafA/YrhL